MAEKHPPLDLRGINRLEFEEYAARDLKRCASAHERNALRHGKIATDRAALEAGNLHPLQEGRLRYPAAAERFDRIRADIEQPQQRTRNRDSR